MAFSPPTGGAGTPEGIIGLQLEGRGFDTLAKDLEVGNKHLAAMEGSVSRMGQGLLGVSRTLAGMAGVAGVGALVADFMRVETAANRAAIAIGYVTGDRNAYYGLERAGTVAGRLTGFTGPQVLSGIATMQAFTGGNYFQNPNAAGGQPAGMAGYLLGSYGNLTGVDPATAAGRFGGILQMQKQTAGSLQGMIGLIASQAQMAGMGGQTDQFAGMVQNLMGQSIGLNPFNAGPGLARKAGSLAGLMMGLSPIYRDPERLSASMGAIQGGLTGAAGNPALQAWLQMSGIGYKEQRSGIVNHPETLLKIVESAKRQFPNSMTRDMFYRANFGLEGANALNEIGLHPHKSKELLEKFNNSVDPQGGLLRTMQSSDQTMKTAQKELVALRQTLSELLIGIYDDVHAIAGKLGAEGALSKATGGKIQDTILTDVLALAVGGGAVKKLLPGGAGAAAARGLSTPGGALALLALAGAGYTAAEARKNPRRDRNKPHSGHEEGPNWLTKLGLDLSGDVAELLGLKPGKVDGKKTPEALKKLEDALRGKVDPDQRLRSSIDKLRKALEDATPKGGRSGASWQGLTKDPQGLGTTSFASAVGAAQYAGYQSAAMVAGLISASGGGGGGGATPVSDTTPTSAPSSPSGGGGWHTGVASTYDPGKGGMNGRWGAGAWSGHPVRPNVMGFAHKTMKFGTLVEFEYKGRKATAQCVDRGPFVAGRDFDFLPALRSALGFPWGVDKVRWRRVGTASKTLTTDAQTGGQTASHRSGGGGPVASVAGGMTLGGGFGSDALGAAGQSGGGVININVDGRRLERFQRLTRAT